MSGAVPWVPVLLLGAAAVTVLSGRRHPRARLGVWSDGVYARGPFRPASGGVAPVVLLGATVVALAAGGPVAAVCAGTYTALALRARRAAVAARRARQAAASVDDLVSGLAADLRAGLLPGPALRLGAESLTLSAAASPVAAAVAAAAAGDDVPTALRTAPVPGGEVGMARLAAAWQVADTSGAPLTEVLDRLDADLTSLRRRRDLVDAQTTAATTTVRMLAVLPVLGLGLGYTLGGDPLGFLLHTAAGAVCALLALALQAAGLLWGEHIAAAPIRSGGV